MKRVRYCVEGSPFPLACLVLVWHKISPFGHLLTQRSNDITIEHMSAFVMQTCRLIGGVCARMCM